MADEKKSKADMKIEEFLGLCTNEQIFEELFRRFSQVVVVAARDTRGNEDADTVIRAFKGGQAAVIGLLTIARHDMLDNVLDQRGEDDGE